MARVCLNLPLSLLLIFWHSVYAQYDPTWESLDKRPLPLWYDESKVGIFVNWGVYSVPSYGNEWFWFNWKGSKEEQIVKFMQKNYPLDFTYPDFASLLNAQLYNPDEWAELFKAAGAKYVVLSTKHHEGFTMWPSNFSFNWNAGAVGAKMDLVGSLADSVRRKTDLHFGLYHSLFEWFNPLYLADKEGGFNTSVFVDGKTLPELYEIVKRYKPDLIWSDGGWEAPDTYWKSRDFLAWLYNSSPVKDTVVTNDRWGKGVTCHHGGYFTCQDRYSPGHLVQHKWENAMTLDKASWGYRRNAASRDYLTIHDLLSELASTISCGGNLLVNVGPTSDGRIPPIMEERLRQLGTWLRINGEAVYSTKPWKYQKDTTTAGVWYTEAASGGAVYTFVLKWPGSGQLELGAPRASSGASAVLLGGGNATLSALQPRGVRVGLTAPVPGSELAAQQAWVVRLSGVSA